MQKAQRSGMKSLWLKVEEVNFMTLSFSEALAFL